MNAIRYSPEPGEVACNGAADRENRSAISAFYSLQVIGGLSSKTRSSVG
jgi:hypothetical protein